MWSKNQQRSVGIVVFWPFLGRFFLFFTKEAVREKAFAAVQEAGSEAQKSECPWHRNFCFQPGRLGEKPAPSGSQR